MSNVIGSGTFAVHCLLERETFGPYKEQRYCGDSASVSASPSGDQHLPYTTKNVPVGEGPDSSTNSGS